MTAGEIYALPINGNGWRKLPSGNYVRLGTDVWLGTGVKLGNFVQLGDGVRLGNDVSLGRYVRLGADVWLGDGVKLGEFVQLGADVRLGDGVRLNVSLPCVQGSNHTAYISAPGMISIGCKVHSFDHWTQHVLAIARQHGYTPAQAAEYQRIVAYLIAEANARDPKDLPHFVDRTSA